MNILKNEKMPVERWQKAVEAGSNQSNYRRERGMTHTADDAFVDGVQWADENPKQSWWRPVSEWPKDGEMILMKLSNGRYQATEWVDDGKGFNSGFAEINFGEGAMMRLPITYEVVAWRPMADIINEYTLYGAQPAETAAPDEHPDPLLSTPLTSCDLSVRTLGICKANGIETLADLTRLHQTDWLKFRGASKKSFTEIDDLLYANGLKWAEY